MADKGNNRSNAKLADRDILRTLNAKGEVKVFSQDYKAFSTGKSNIEKKCRKIIYMQMLLKDACKDEIIQSPLNYTGGKFKLLPQILPLFPKILIFL